MKVPFNIPYTTGQEIKFIDKDITSKQLSGNGVFTKKCQNWFKESFVIKHCLLTTSCTDALEMTGILADIQPEDEVIIPSYTFVSAANAFVLRGAKIVYADSLPNHPNIDHTQIESLITPNTKAIIIVHYAGVACEMDSIMSVAERHNLIVVEDAAQAIGVKYKDKYLGTIGHFGTYSFHATKNIHCGEGGLLIVNDDQYIKRSEIIWEKGTNRAAFMRGEVDKYTWVDVGSSFLPSELNAAFLWAQLQEFDQVQNRRISAWNIYFEKLSGVKQITLPNIFASSTNNAHVFYLLCSDLDERDKLTSHLREKSIQAYFHFLPLHKSPLEISENKESSLPNAERFDECLLRLPIHNNISLAEVEYVSNTIIAFYKKNT